MQVKKRAGQLSMYVRARLCAPYLLEHGETSWNELLCAVKVLLPEKPCLPRWCLIVQKATGCLVEADRGGLLPLLTIFQAALAVALWLQHSDARLYGVFLFLTAIPPCSHPEDYTALEPEVWLLPSGIRIRTYRGPSADASTAGTAGTTTS